MQRASQVFQAQGWSNLSAGSSMVLANKGIHSSYITCNEVGNGYTLVNVFVASDSGPGEVPGAERVVLQQAMAGQVAVAPQPVPCGLLRVDKLGSDSVRLSWQGAPTDGDEWFTVVPAGSADNVYNGNYLRPDRQAAGSRDWPIRLGAGNWEYRFYADNGYVVGGRCSFRMP